MKLRKENIGDWICPALIDIARNDFGLEVSTHHLYEPNDDALLIEIMVGRYKEIYRIECPEKMLNFSPEALKEKIKFFLGSFKNNMNAQDIMEGGPKQ